MLRGRLTVLLLMLWLLGLLLRLSWQRVGGTIRRLVRVRRKVLLLLRMLGWLGWRRQLCLVWIGHRIVACRYWCCDSLSKRVVARSVDCRWLLWWIVVA